jgi:hypothetical protein
MYAKRTKLHHGTYKIARCVGLEEILDILKKRALFTPAAIRTPNCPVRSLTIIPTELSRLLQNFSGDAEGKHFLVDLNRSVTSRRTLHDFNESVWTGFNWLRIGTIGHGKQRSVATNGGESLE